MDMKMKSYKEWELAPREEINMFELDKFSLIILTRCNLRCQLCCEYVPMNKPFPDMTLDEEKTILDSFFQVVDYVHTLHLTGGGEPFLHPHLPEMIDTAMAYKDRFDRLMLFTNCTVSISDDLISAMKNHKDKVFVQLSHYRQKPESEESNLKLIEENGIHYRLRKYYGDDQSFGGWVDFGGWECRNRNNDEMHETFQNCSVTSVMHGNWRTRDGKVHWCSRSQRGTELGLMPDDPAFYVDLLDNAESAEEKRNKFRAIAEGHSILACNYCSGDQGTTDREKRYAAAEQL